VGCPNTVISRLPAREKKRDRSGLTDGLNDTMHKVMQNIWNAQNVWLNLNDADVSTFATVPLILYKTRSCRFQCIETTQISKSAKYLKPADCYVLWWFFVSWMTTDTGLSDMGRVCLIYRGREIDRRRLIVYVWLIVHDRVFDWWRVFDGVCLIC